MGFTKWKPDITDKVIQTYKPQELTQSSTEKSQRITEITIFPYVSTQWFSVFSPVLLCVSS